MNFSIPVSYTLNKDALKGVVSFVSMWLTDHKGEIMAREHDRINQGTIQIDHAAVFSGWQGELCDMYQHLALEKALSSFFTDQTTDRQFLVRYCIRVLTDMASHSRDIHLYTIYNLK